MPEKKMKNIKRELIEQKLNLVVEKLMNLGGPENEAELKDGGEAIGFFKRDFGIAEWDWPQGVGLYGLLKMMKIQKSAKNALFSCLLCYNDNINQILESIAQEVSTHF